MVMTVKVMMIAMVVNHGALPLPMMVVMRRGALAGLERRIVVVEMVEG